MYTVQCTGYLCWHAISWVGVNKKEVSWCVLTLYSTSPIFPFSEYNMDLTRFFQDNQNIAEPVASIHLDPLLVNKLAFISFLFLKVRLSRLALRATTEWAHSGQHWTCLTAWTTLGWAQTCQWGAWTTTMAMVTSLPMHFHTQWIRYNDYTAENKDV